MPNHFGPIRKKEMTTIQSTSTVKTKMAEFWADAKRHAPEIALEVGTATLGVIGGLWAWKHVKKYLK